MHFIPTYSSWLNQVERFFALITEKAIRRGSFSSVKRLIRRIVGGDYDFVRLCCLTKECYPARM